MHGYHVETRTLSLMKGPLDQMKSRKQSRGDPTRQGDQALGMVCLTGPQTIVKLIKSVCGLPIPHGLNHLGWDTFSQQGSCSSPSGRVCCPVQNSMSDEKIGGDRVYCVTFQGCSGSGGLWKGTKDFVVSDL